MALAEDLMFVVGDTWRSKRWALVAAGEVVDLADGWSVRAQIRLAPTGPPIHTFEDAGIEFGTAEFTVAGAQVTGATVRLHLSSTDSMDLAPMTGVWDLQAEHPTFDNGAPYRKTLVSGKVRGVSDVTR